MKKDPQSSKLRRNSASALVNLTNTAPETMEPFFDMIHSTACEVVYPWVTWNNFISVDIISATCWRSSIIIRSSCYALLASKTPNVFATTFNRTSYCCNFTFVTDSTKTGRYKNGRGVWKNDRLRLWINWWSSCWTDVPLSKQESFSCLVCLRLKWNFRGSKTAIENSITGARSQMEWISCL